MFQDRLAQSQLDLEALPLLKAQVEVYQSDFNAEREARERIAGEKADLVEEMKKLQKKLRQAEVQAGAGAEQRRAGEIRETAGTADIRERINSLQLVDRTVQPQGPLHKQPGPVHRRNLR